MHIDNWDKKASQAKAAFPLKIPQKMPNMIPIVEETKRHLKWKSLKWMIQEDKNGQVRAQFLKKPLRYAFKFLLSLCKKQAHLRRDGDFFLYGIHSLNEFEALLKKPNTLLVLGFSFCHKPFECPSGRFSTHCSLDLENPICQQCFIGKCKHFLPKENSRFLCITTVHYIAEEMLKWVHAHRDKEIIFIISACELTLKMFGDLGNMASIKGLGLRLGGRICNTFQAFALAEHGTKPGLTLVEEEAQAQVLTLIRLRK